MVNRYTKLRLRRRLKVQTKSLQKVGDQAGQHFDKHVVGRWRNLYGVRRFVVGWLLLVGLLIGGVYVQKGDLERYYLADIPVAGGTYREGVVGNFTNLNPIFATSAADSAAAALMFNSLLKYDDNNNLVGDLAQSWTVDDEGVIYTVNLRHDIVWHDNRPFTADDVVFTYETIQHPDTRSYLAASWRNITVDKVDDYTVTFTLPNPFAPFLVSLAEGGILPANVLGDIIPGELRSHPFNVDSPIGTGPFKFIEITSTNDNSTLLRMQANKNYHFGAPKLDNFVLQTFLEREDMAKSFLDGDIAAAGGLQTEDRAAIVKDNDSTWLDLPLNNAVFAFMKTTDELLKSTELRRALAQATDRIAIHEALNARYGILEGPLLRNQLGYDDSVTEVDYNPLAAEKALDKLGWKKRSDGFRYKNNIPLQVRLVTQSSDDYPTVAQLLSDQWATVGVSVEVYAVTDDIVQENHIAPHNYQILLFGIALGSDPDVFAYWHSSQTGINGFNLSEYSNSLVDAALEGGRTRLDKELRAAKYKTFLEQWTADMPAIALYQPAYSYVMRRDISGFNVTRLNSPGDRYTNVQLWSINTRSAPQPL